MNKNPFAVAPSSYTQHQPPLPPGPPPAQPAQPDYSAYWAAATTAAQAQSGIAAYNPQWPGTAQAAQPVPPRPPPEQSALYANYGYGNQHWQQRQQPQQHFQPPPPVVQPPPAPPPQPAYNPYQPQAGAYQQPYVPQVQVNPPPPVAPQAAYTPQMPAVQQYQQPQQQFYPQQQQQNRQQHQNRNMQHASPQHLPPAKRPRFEGPSQPRGAPPQFQPPPPPSQQPPSGPLGGGVNMGFGPGHAPGGRGGPPGVNQVPLGARGSFTGGRGGPMGRGRGMGGMNRGGYRGGKSGGMYNSMGGRGGGPGQGGGSFRGGFNRGFGNRDNRRGASFSGAGGQGFAHGQQQAQQQQAHHQQNYSGSFRGRNLGFNNSMRGGRHDASLAHGPKDASSSSASKKDENRRTLTDFKIIGLEIQDLHWSWGTVPKASVAPEVKGEPDSSSLQTSSALIVTETEDADQKPKIDSSTHVESQSSGSDVPPKTSEADQSVGADRLEVSSAPAVPPPPSRIRIYFHTPVTADDSHSISAYSSVSLLPSSESSVRKGKRKKLEDDEDGDEEGRGPPPPPPQHSGLEHESASVAPSVEMDGSETPAGRESVAPSVAETASEGDWLMAAIGEDEGDAEGTEGHHAHGSDHAHAAHEAHEGDADADADAEGEPDDYGHDYDDVEAQLDVVDDHHYAVDEGKHDNAPSHESGSLPPGLDGQRDVPPDPPHLDEASHPDTHAAPPAEESTSSAPVSDPAESSTAVDSVSVKTADDVHAPSMQSGGVPDQTLSTQVQSAVETHLTPTPAPLRASDSLATVIDDSDAHEAHSSYASTIILEHSQDAQDDDDVEMHVTQIADEHSQTQHDEKMDVPLSPSTASTTLPPPSVSDAPRTNGTSSTTGEGIKAPSADRLSISYASGTRRMVIDAEVVQKLKVFRTEARIEIHMKVTKEDERFAGILFEGTSESSASYKALTIAEASEDPTVPPFTKATLPMETILIAYLDKDRPLSEPRWVKTGDVQDWLKSIFGRMFWTAGEAAKGWEKKIEVADPDPAPTIWRVLEAWATNTNVGTQTERQRFLRTHMTETDNILEILLRLVRGERASYSQGASAIAVQSVSGPLLSALSQGSAHGAQQTHVSLAVLAIFRLAVEYAKKAVGEAGKGEAEERVGEIIRCLPSHLIYKSLDGIFKEWRVDKKGGR